MVASGRVSLIIFVKACLALTIIGLLAYVSKPLKTTAYIYPVSVENQTQLSCTEKLGSTFFPSSDLNSNQHGRIDAEISKGGMKLAIEINGQILRLLTTTAVESGMQDAADFTILRNNKRQLVAVYYPTEYPDAGINSFVLNKSNGYAVWSKLKPSLLYVEQPDSQMYYLECK